jgi:CBS domain-containing protein
MIIVKQILDSKGYEVSSIDGDESVLEAIRLLAEKEIGALLVTDKGRPVGLFSERDYARKVALKGRSSQNTLVKEIMETRVPAAHPEQDIEECMAIMTDKRVRHLPVTNLGEVVGIVSIGDLIKAIIADQQFTIEQLERYIAG